jgi:hypothetical protein
MSWRAEALKKIILIDDWAFVMPDAGCGKQGSSEDGFATRTQETGLMASRKQE